MFFSVRRPTAHDITGVSVCHAQRHLHTKKLYGWVPFNPIDWEPVFFSVPLFLANMSFVTHGISSFIELFRTHASSAPSYCVYGPRWRFYPNASYAFF